MAFAEFRPVGPALSAIESETKTFVKLGTVFSFADVLEQSRGTGHNPGDKALRPWFPGNVINSETSKDKNQLALRFSFNSSNQGWHYAWQSNRMSRTAKHELHVFILAGSGTKQSSTFTCVCELSSNTFDVRCRKKKDPSIVSEKKMQAQTLMHFAGLVHAGATAIGIAPAEIANKRNISDVTNYHAMEPDAKQRVLDDRISPTQMVKDIPSSAEYLEPDSKSADESTAVADNLQLCTRKLHIDKPEQRDWREQSTVEQKPLPSALDVLALLSSVQ
jgi:hypothetical protein